MCIRDRFKWTESFKENLKKKNKLCTNNKNNFTHLTPNILPVPSCELDSKGLTVACKLSGGVCDDLNKRNNQEN